MKKGYGLWKDDFDAMARKTVIKMLLSKYAPMNTDMAKAHEIDQAVVTDEQTLYLDNEKMTAEEKAEISEIERITNYIGTCKTTDDLEKCQEAVFEAGNEELNALYASKRKQLEGKK